ncbi:MAG: hypothetical protein ABT20_07340 [Rubrivivax sp. SCN 70-15]|nr:MAG: hypothetical protein ABT20_07340 [Rubrivivax sp. SCN 70-15]
MRTAWSIGGPSPPRTGASGVPVIGTTSRYSDGAKRRFRRSSSAQKCRRSARRLKSRKPGATAFLIL